jgi:hypothetical protein
LARANGTKTRLAAGEHALHGLGQLRAPRQTPTDPTGILAQGRRQGALAQPLGQDRRQQPGLLDGLEGAALVAGQDLHQGLAERGLPELDPGGIAAEALQRRPALVASDQHPAWALGHDHQWHPLAIGVAGGHQPADLLGALHPALGIGGIEPMQIERKAVHGGGVHGPHPRPIGPARAIESALCKPPPERLNRLYYAEYKQVFAVYMAPFAIRPTPRLHSVSACR